MYQLLSRLAILSLCVSAAHAQPIIVLDAGHEPSKSGARGSCQKKEVVYNDELVAFVQRALAKDYQVILTRHNSKELDAVNPTLIHSLPAKDRKRWTQNKSLLARPAIANRKQADLFISIHHDSTLEKQQRSNPDLCQGHGGKTLSAAFKKKYNIGYNVFIYQQGQSPRQRQSLKLANLVAKQLYDMGRTPSNYHVYPDDSCKSCLPVNKTIGVWQADFAVLRNTDMPAILIEAGNIVDAEDEARINNDPFRERFSLAIKNAVDAYFK